MSKVVERKVTASKSSAAQSPAGAGGPASPQKASSPSGDGKKESSKKSSKSKKEADDDDDEDAGETGEVEDKKGQEDAAALRAEVEPILKSSQFSKALTMALGSTSHSAEVAKVATELALSAMDNIKTDEIGKIVEAASDEFMDALMKTAYAGMALGRNCSNMLTWHAKLSEKGGLGVVMRAMCVPQN